MYVMVWHIPVLQTYSESELLDKFNLMVIIPDVWTIFKVGTDRDLDCNIQSQVFREVTEVKTS